MNDGEAAQETEGRKFRRRPGVESLEERQRLPPLVKTPCLRLEPLAQIPPGCSIRVIGVIFGIIFGGGNQWRVRPALPEFVVRPDWLWR